MPLQKTWRVSESPTFIYTTSPFVLLRTELTDDVSTRQAVCISEERVRNCTSQVCECAFTHPHPGSEISTRQMRVNCWQRLVKSSGYPPLHSGRQGHVQQRDTQGGESIIGWSCTCESRSQLIYKSNVIEPYSVWLTVEVHWILTNNQWWDGYLWNVIGYWLLISM